MDILFVKIGLVLLFLVALWQMWRGYMTVQKTQSLTVAYDGARVGVVVFNAIGNMVHANRYAIDTFLEAGGGALSNLAGLWGYLYDHALPSGDPLHDVLSASDEAMAFRDIVRADCGGVFLVEARSCESGDTVITLHDISRFQMQHNKLERLHKINHDLSEAMQSASCGVMLCDPKPNPPEVVFLNRACCAMFVVSQSQLDRSSIDEFLDRLGFFEGKRDVLHALREGLAFHEEIKCDIEQNSFWFDLRVTPVFDVGGTLDLCVAVFTDISSLKFREAELSRSHKLDALGRLSAGVAHDFNNVLSIIDGYTRMGVTSVNDPKEALACLEKIKNASDRGADLTKQMLTFSQHRIVRDDVVDLSAIVDEQQALVRPVLDPSIAFSIDIAEDNLCVHASMNAVTQILLNLCINAQHAMNGRGALHVKVNPCAVEHMPEALRDDLSAEAYVCLSVCDDGCGIDDDIIKHIFDPFYTTKKQGEGTGLGLSVVYGLVQEIGGRIHVESTVGQGTCFYVYFERSNEKPKQAIAPNQAFENIDFHGYTALVAEDEDDLRHLITKTLEGRGMHVLSAADGQDALLISDDYDGVIDILVSDIVMPNLDGLKLAELMQSLRDDVSVLFISGYPARGDMADIELPDDAVFLSKPIDYDAFLRVVAALLSSDSAAALAGVEAYKSGQWKDQRDVVLLGA